MPVLKNSDNLTKIFVYGTLKQGQPNFGHMIERNAIFVDKAITVDKWPLVIASEANIPFLLYKKDFGHVCNFLEKMFFQKLNFVFFYSQNIKGEIYLVDDETLEFLDEFEGLHQNFYSKQKISVKSVLSGDIHEAFCYVLENFKPYLIENTKYLLDDYDSNNNQFNLSYVKRIDTPDRADSLIEQVKYL
jgi:gamma-glutamylaminecyclotransferase